MNNELLISRLDELIGDFDTPFFNYLIYSYDLDLNDCELIIEDIMYDLKTRDMDCDNLVLLIDSYFKAKIIENEKENNAFSWYLGFKETEQKCLKEFKD